MFKFTSYNDNYYACDFETTSANTKYFKETNETKVYLAYAKRFHPNGLDQEPDEILTVSIEEFFEEFFKRKQSATMFFHNLKFDGEFIKWYLSRNGYQYYFEPPQRKTRKGFTILEDAKNIYFINVFKPVRDGKKIKIVQLYIRCSLNLLTLSIDKLAKAFKLPNKTSIDYDVEPFNSLDEVPSDIIDYIKNDVNIMIPPLIQYNEVFTVRLGNRTLEGLSKLTIGSTSLMLFKAFIYGTHQFKQDFFLPYELVNELKPWYCGGLTTYSPEYQYNITENIEGCVYDVNSMYPSVMVENEYPIGIPEKHKKDASYKIHLVKIAIKHAKIKNSKWPPLMRPWKSMTMDYPDGVRYIQETEHAIAYYFEDELESLKRFYDIEYEIMDHWWFKSANYFAKFISDHYEIRKKYKKENDPREYTLKIFLNNAYGKFGQKPDKTSIIYSPEKLEKGETIIKTDRQEYIIDTVREDANCIEGLYSYICYGKEPPARTINIMIAACITKNARIKLHNAIWENIDNFLYCDTDSVFLKGKAKGLDIDENKLGAWKLEMEFDGFELGGAKLYNIYMKGVKIKSAHAGINKKWADKNLKKNDIITIDKKLGKGSKMLKHKVKGGVILEETEFTIKRRQ